MKKTSTLALLASISLTSIVSATTDWPSTGCIAPSAFSSCISQAKNTYTTCTNPTCDWSNTTDLETNPACGTSDPCACEENTSKINCALTYCWNLPYSCAYQQTMLSVLANCSGTAADHHEPYPYFPALDNVTSQYTGSCECNLGVAFAKVADDVDITWTDMYALNLTDVYGVIGPLDDLDADGRDVWCCGASGAMSSIYDTCPNTNPSIILSLLSPYFSIILPANSTESLTSTFSSSSSTICADVWSAGSNKTNCTALFNDDYDGDTLVQPAHYYSPEELSALGAGTSRVDGLLDQTAGVSITSPLSGWTVTWEAVTSKTYTVTAVNADADADATATASASASNRSSGASASASKAATSGSGTSLSLRCPAVTEMYACSILLAGAVCALMFSL